MAKIFIAIPNRPSLKGPCGIFSPLGLASVKNVIGIMFLINAGPLANPCFTSRDTTAWGSYGLNFTTFTILQSSNSDTISIQPYTLASDTSVSSDGVGINSRAISNSTKRDPRKLSGVKVEREARSTSTRKMRMGSKVLSSRSVESYTELEYKREKFLDRN
jgi:hypothetical protein